MVEFPWPRFREDETAARALKPGKSEDMIGLRGERHVATAAPTDCAG